MRPGRGPHLRGVVKPARPPSCVPPARQRMRATWRQWHAGSPTSSRAHRPRDCRRSAHGTPMRSPNFRECSARSTAGQGSRPIGRHTSRDTRALRRVSAPLTPTTASARRSPRCATWRLPSWVCQSSQRPSVPIGERWPTATTDGWRHATPTGITPSRRPPRQKSAVSAARRPGPTSSRGTPPAVTSPPTTDDSSRVPLPRRVRAPRDQVHPGAGCAHRRHAL